MVDGSGELVAMSISTGTETIRVMMSVNCFFEMYRYMRRDLHELLESSRSADVALFVEEGGKVTRHSRRKAPKDDQSRHRLVKITRLVPRCGLR